MYFLFLIAAIVWILVLTRRIQRAEARLNVLESSLPPNADDKSAATEETERTEEAAVAASSTTDEQHAETAEVDEPQTPAVAAASTTGVSEVVFGSGESAIRIAGSSASMAGETGSEEEVPEPSAKSASEAGDFEKALGSRWAIWVGGLALAMGGVFLVRYSIEQGIFGPAVRLSIAAAAGVVALVAGELIRRRDIQLAFAGDQAAYVPGILTAAGSAILFAVTYAAHGLYEFIGPVISFAVLAVISLTTIMLSLRHGPLLAALGLAGSYVTPALVSSQSPNPWVLFSYLAVILAASTWLARIRNRVWIVNSALIGTALWAIGFAASAPTEDISSLTLPVASIILVILFVWERGRRNRLLALTSYGRYRHRPVHLGVVTVTLIALAALSDRGQEDLPVQLTIGASVLLLLMLAAVRRSAWLAVPAAAALASSALLVWSRLSGFAGADLLLGNAVISSATPPIEADYTGTVLLASILFLSLGSVMAGRLCAVLGHSVIWALAAASVPLAGYALSALLFADLNSDLRYGTFAVVLAVMFGLAAAYLVFQQKAEKKGTGAVAVFLAAAALAIWAAAHLLSSPSWTGLILAIAALVATLAWRTLRYDSLGWIASAFAVSVTARFAYDPAIALELSKTPVFNWLLPGYYVPAVVFGLCAWIFGRNANAKPQRIMEGLSATAAILGAAVLIRHGMSGGVLEGDGPVTLGEQTLYTLLSLVASATLIRLDDRSPSPVFRFGSMLVGYIGLARAIYAHAFPLNPLFNADLVGEHLLWNLVTAGYLLPAVCALALWWFARSRRPAHYVLYLGIVSQFFLVAWVGLAVRHFFNAPILAHFLNPPASTLEAFSYAPAYLVAAIIALALSRKILAGMFFTVAKVLSTAGLLVSVAINLGLENPLLTNAAMGMHPIFNLVVLGYLVPAGLLVFLCCFTRGLGGSFTPRLNVALGIASGLFFFVWVSFTIRWFYQGDFIGAWKGAIPAETYTYSALWLVLGVAVLVLGQKMGSRLIRMASAGLVTLTVVKVFLIDMSELEGVLRAFSFMGLGAALIGIGLFYQRIFISSKK